MFIGLICAVGTIISLTFGGVGMGTEEVDLINSLTVFKQANILGTWSVSVPNITFFTVGMKSLINLDFAFFSGYMELLRWLLYMTIGLGFLWGLYTTVLGVITGLFRR
jgi:hypothetical protein